MTSDVPRGIPQPAGPDLDIERALALLNDGDIEVQGRLVEASNTTLYCAISVDGLSAACVYKPVRGERPLWDFPDGTLAAREVAAYAVSAASRWNVVPPTVLREGPLGPGMVQLWIDADDTVDLAALVRSDTPALRRMALLDAVINNADRKGGHLLPMPDGHVYGVDHGVCFAEEPKLRTLLWGWRGQRLIKTEVRTLLALREDLDNGLGDRLRSLLTEREVQATSRRIEELLGSGCFPFPSPEWPAIPWPPF